MFTNEVSSLLTTGLVVEVGAETVAATVSVPIEVMLAALTATPKF